MTQSQKLFIINTLMNEGYERNPYTRKWTRIDNGKEFDTIDKAYEDYVKDSNRLR